MFLEFASCQLPNYAENTNFQIRISQNAKNPFYAPLLVNPRIIGLHTHISGSFATVLFLTEGGPSEERIKLIKNSVTYFIDSPFDKCAKTTQSFCFF